MISSEDVMIAEPRIWVCLVCAKEYRYLKALKKHVKKYHPEMWNVAREQLKELKATPAAEDEEPMVQEEPVAHEEPIAVLEESVVQEAPLPAPKSSGIPTKLQEQFPFAEKWADLSNADRVKIQVAIDKVRPESHLADVLDFRIVDELVIMVHANGQKYKVDIEQL